MIYDNKKSVILAVDDDPIILNSVLSTLKDEYTVVPFTSGDLALSYLEERSADLILLDLEMPGMSGFDVLVKLLKNQTTYKIPVIFLTGSIDADGEATALQMGAVDYILKPIRPQALLTRVGVQLELQAHRKRLETLVREKTINLNLALEKLEKREENIFNLLARVTDIRDSDTGMHIERSAKYTAILSNHINANPREGYILNDSQREDIIKASKLHDLGKIAIPDTILLKPGKLTTEEFIIMKTHTLYGEQLIEDLIDSENSDNLMIIAKDIIKYHHEKWDGSGYPCGLKDVQIPLAARIAAVADVYDALTSRRCYKEPFTHEKSIEIIEEDSRKHFDPYLVEIVLLHSEDFKNISQNPKYMI
ncbi:MAG: response regulator [Eubacterium sp.]|jgi:putative two-component system response regulator|nr:response regulator [Eubacterium sp.]